MKLIVLLLALLNFINGQSYVPGKCPEVAPVTHMQNEKFIGYWYLASKVPEEIATGVKCGKDHIKSFETNKFHGIFTAIIEKTNTTISMPYVVKYKGDLSTAEFLIEIAYEGKIKTEDVKLISGDLDKYALYWGCREVGPKSRRIVYLMGKTKTLPEDVLKKIKEDMERNKLEYSSLQFELNDNCPN